jgi:copper(I)-binding protein
LPQEAGRRSGVPMRNIFLAAVLPLLAASCGPTAPRVNDAWVRLSAVPGRPAAGYFTIYPSRKGVILVGVTSPRVRRIEMHEGMAQGMAKLSEASAAPDADIRFTPGSRHLMLFGIDPRIKPGDTVPLRFEVSPGPPITVEALVVRPGAFRQ